MDRTSTTTDKTIISILNELTENKIIDIKATKSQLDKLYYSKYNRTSNINIKKFDDNVLLYGIIFKQGTSKPIRFDWRVFKFLNDNKDKIMQWVSKFYKYPIEDIKESNDSIISTYDIFELTLNEFNNNLIIKMDVNKIDTFEHDEIQPYFIRMSNFIKLLNNIPYVMKLINES
tara:strand:+ start:618 stop:1139 length:522 start_codon:yes stop_codon:yes gene_type:complete